MLSFHLYLFEDFFKISILIHFLTHWLFRNVLKIFHIFEDFLAFLLVLISSFVPLWTEKIVWFNLLKLVKTVLYHIM